MVRSNRSRHAGAAPGTPFLVALAIAAVLAFPALAAAEIPPSLRGLPVRDVRVEGPMRGRFAPEELGIPLGAPLDRPLLRAATLRLVRDGRFADVQLDVVPVEGGVRVVATLAPRVVVASIEVDGNDLLDEAQVVRVLGLEEGSEVDVEALDAHRQRLLERYAERGHHGAEVALALDTSADPTRGALRVRIVEGQPTRVEAVRFDGDPLPDDDGGAARALDLASGDVLDERELEDHVRAAERRLREAGWLEARLGPPAIHRVGARATVTIPSRLGRHYRVVVRGNAPIARDEVVEALDLAADPLGRAVADAMAGRVVELYVRSGFVRAEASVRRLATDRPGEAQLLVEVTPGAPLEIVEIALPGAAFFEARFLRGQIESYLSEAVSNDRLTAPVDPDAVSRLVEGTREAPRVAPRPYASDPARVYVPRAYEEAIEHLEELYEEEGFLAARVGPYRVEDVSPERARVVVPIEEGPRTLVHALEITGNAALSTHEVAVAAGLFRGSPYSPTALERARERVLDLYRERGHLYADVLADVRISADGTRSAVALQVVERHPVIVGEVRIEGAERTDLGMLRALVTLHTGDVYRPSLARRTQERFLELGVFSAVNVTPADPEVPERVKPIVVTVTERPPQLVDFALGASSAQGIRGAFEYGYGNLFGHAVRFTLRVQLAGQFFYLDDVLRERYAELSVADRLERRISASLLLPYMPGIPNLRTSVSVLHQRENERTFGIDRNALNVSFTHRPSRRVQTSLGSSIEYNDVALLVDDEYDRVLAETTDPRLRQLLLVPEGKSALVAFESTASVDLRDSPFDPTRGFFASVTAEWARSIATEDVEVAGEEQAFFSHHLRAMLNASAYAPLGGGVVLAFQGRYGRVIQLAGRSQTYPNRQFFLGGVDTMRAYRQQAMIPEDLAEQIADGVLDPDVVVQGGDTFLLFRGELRFPIYGDLGAGIFTDIGNLWVDPRELEVLALRPTLGLGIRVKTPIGPIALDYGVNLLYNRPSRRPLDESVGAFNFSIGLF